MVGKEGMEIMCVIKYERLPTFCYVYGRIGHNTCAQFSPGMSKIEFRFRSWLRVQLTQAPQGPSRWRNRIESSKEKNWKS